MTVIVILALVALFIGLRLYSVLGERTGHEQQPILRPADAEARLEPRVDKPAAAAAPAADSGDMAFVPTAGPGVRAILAADQSFDVLIAEMRKDKLLLAIETDELAQQVERDRAELMDLLKKSVEAAAPSPSNK